MVLVENRPVDQIPYVLFIPLGEVQHGFRIPRRRLPQSLPFRILPDTFEDGLHCPSQLLDTLVGLFGGRIESLPRSGAYSVRSSSSTRCRMNLHGQLSPSKSIGGFRV